MAKTGPQCSICAHPKRHQIEIGLTYRVPARALARRFDCSADAIHRHARSHLSPATKAAILAARKPSAIDLDALRTEESEGLLSQLIAQRARLQQHSEIAIDMGDVRGAVSAENGITANLALVSKLLGMLVQHHEVRRTSILISADYLQLRSTILAALRPYPEAAAAVSRALHELETAAAKEITESKRPLVIEHDATAECAA